MMTTAPLEHPSATSRLAFSSSTTERHVTAPSCAFDANIFMLRTACIVVVVSAVDATADNADAALSTSQIFRAECALLSSFLPAATSHLFDGWLVQMWLQELSNAIKDTEEEAPQASDADEASESPACL